MTFIGKILIGFICVMSLVFMSLAMAVYSTHKDWRGIVERPEALGPGAELGLKFQIENANKDKDLLTTEKEKLQQELAAEETAKRQALSKLATEQADWNKKLTEIKKERDDLFEKDKASTAALRLAQQNLAKLTDEVGGLRTEIRTTQANRDEQFRKVVALTDDLQQMQGEGARLKERGVQLVADLNKATSKLRTLGLTADDPVNPKVLGKVLAANADKMVEISLGVDDGIRAGAQLDVFRGNKYLARIEILSTTPHRAVGKILPQFDLAPIQQDDNVTTRFESGDRNARRSSRKTEG